ncbi:nucleotidyltransferase family protein [Rhodohalobacter sp. 8-1]|uniref:nucleotidyltransferase family protein n=1 Tax=Rhodohalobacter sp. 8-1 TaxID=3131972 RepID=UPI0030ECAAC1
MITQKEQDIIIQTLSPYKPKKIGVFGSRARSEQTESSDLDLLVDLENINLLELVALEDELSHLLGVKVDLVTESSLNRYIRPMVKQEVRYILNHKDDLLENEK